MMLPDVIIVTYIFTAWATVLLPKLTVSQLVKNSPSLFGTLSFITGFKNYRRLPVLWTTLIHSMPSIHFLKIDFNIILSSNPRSSKWSLYLRLPHQYHVYIYPLIRATRHTQNFLLDLITLTIFREQYRSLSSSLCSFLHSLVNSSLLDQNISLNPLFSNTLNLRSSLKVNDELPHPHKTTGQFIVLYVFTFILLKRKDER